MGRPHRRRRPRADRRASINEGLGSLYEQSEFQENKLIGLENWRLPDLQKAIADGKLGSMVELATGDFCGPKMGLNYAQARYFCFYLQQQGLLEKYYREFRDHYKDDPTGLKQLRKVLAPRKIEDVEAEELAWVKKLRFPAR